MIEFPPVPAAMSKWNDPSLHRLAVCAKGDELTLFRVFKADDGRLMWREICDDARVVAAVCWCYWWKEAEGHLLLEDFEAADDAHRAGMEWLVRFI